MANALVKFDNFSKTYGAVEAVKELNLEIQPGECYALLGPNGSGKSTLIRALVGLILPTKGKIYFDGNDISRLSREDKLRMSYLPQRIAFPAKFSAREVIELFAKLHGKVESDVDKVLEYVDLTRDANRYIKEFSGGMLQRLGLATVLMTDSELLVLDEPTLNLDPYGREIFRDAIHERKRNGKAVILTSHIVQDAEQLAQKVGIMVNGRLVVEKSIQQFRQQLTAETRVRVLMRETTDLMKQAAQIAGASLVEHGSEVLMFTAPSDRRLAIIHAIEKAGGDILEFHSESPDWTSLIKNHTLADM